MGTDKYGSNFVPLHSACTRFYSHAAEMKENDPPTKITNDMNKTKYTIKYRRWLQALQARAGREKMMKTSILCF
jgi:hypothetical protein